MHPPAQAFHFGCACVMVFVCIFGAHGNQEEMTMIELNIVHPMLCTLHAIGMAVFEIPFLIYYFDLLCCCLFIYSAKTEKTVCAVSVSACKICCFQASFMSSMQKHARGLNCTHTFACAHFKSSLCVRKCICATVFFLFFFC